MNEKDVVEVMVRAIEDGCVDRGYDVYGSIAELAKSALTALEAAGYTISRSSHGVVHRREGFEGE